MSAIPPGTGLPPSPTEPFPPVSPGPPNNRLPGWASGNMADIRQQLLSGVQNDTTSPAGLPLVKVAKGARRGAGQVWGKILATGIDPSATAHDILKTESISGQLTALWQHMHLADLPLGSANLVFVEDATGNPALALIVNANIDPAAAIPYSKLNLTNSIVTADIVDGTIINQDVSIAAGIAYQKLNLLLGIVNADVSNSAAISRLKLEADPAGRCQTPNGAANTTGVAFGITWTTSAYQNTVYATWNGATAISAMTTGTYNVSGLIIWPANATGYRQSGFRYSGAINGSLDVRMAVTTAGVATVQGIFEQRRLTAGDYVEMICQQNSGGSLPPLVDGRSYMALEYVGN